MSTIKNNTFCRAGDNSAVCGICYCRLSQCRLTYSIYIMHMICKSWQYFSMLSFCSKMTLGLPCVFSVMVGDTQIALKKMKQRQSKLRSQIPLRHPTGVKNE